MLLLGKGCPMNCLYCYASGGESNEMMSEGVAEQAVAAYLATNPENPKVTLFGGGEPTLNVRAIKHIVEKYGNRVRWVLTTSGILSQDFLTWLIERGVTITFSVDGPPMIQNHLRPLKGRNPSSPIVERSMRLWLEKSGKPLAVRTTLTKESAHQIDEILGYFDAIGVKKVHLEPLYEIGRAVSTTEKGTLMPPSAKEWVEVVIKALRWAKEKDKYVQIGELTYFLQPSAAAYCGPICGKTIVVNHQGMLTACSEVIDNKAEEWNQ